MLDMISIFLNLLRLVLCPTMWSIFENVPCVLKRMYTLLLWGEMFCKYQLSLFDLRLCSMTQYSLFESNKQRIFFGILCLEDQSIVDTGMLKSLMMTVLLSIFLRSSKIFLMYLGAPLLGTYMFTGLYPLVGSLP